jgi:hypothetical protein
MENFALFYLYLISSAYIESDSWMMQIMNWKDLERNSEGKSLRWHFIKAYGEMEI